LPSGRDLKKMAATFQLSEADTDTLFHAASQAAPRIENLPYRRNAFFTGRNELLAHLWMALSPGQALALSQAQAITGLGGIGKTQVALEFAYQHRSDYRTVLWTLSDTRESLVSGYVAIARLLHLPEKDEQDQGKTVEAVKRWFTTHTGWLLI